MRILMLNNEFPPLGGGTGTVNQAILAQLGQVPGLEIDLVTSAPGNHFEVVQFAGQIKIYRLPVNRWNIHHASNLELLIYSIRALWTALSLHRRDPYHLCFAWSAVPAGAVSFALRHLVGLKYIVRVCGPDIPGFERRYGLLYPTLTPIIRAVWKRAETVIAKCQGEADMILSVDRCVNILIVQNGVDLAAFQPAAIVPDEGPLRLLCVGRLIERKGQNFLIESVKKLSDQGVDVILDLVGTGDAEAAYRAQAERLGVAGRVNFHGYVPREEIAQFYSAAHGFVLPSYNEGMSVATLEAMASGLPVIVTRTAGTAELVEEGINGFIFEWGNVETLTDLIHRLAKDRTLTREMGVASRARAASLSWREPAERYLEMFRQIAVDAPSPGALISELK